MEVLMERQAQVDENRLKPMPNAQDLTQRLYARCKLQPRSAQPWANGVVVRGPGSLRQA